VDWLVVPYVSEKHTASIFRAEDGDSIYKPVHTGPKFRIKLPITILYLIY
jgi:hypothetical protein